MITITQLFTKAKHWEHPIKKRKLYGKISKDYLPVGLPVISDKKINCCLITYTLCLAVSKERHYVLFFNTWMYCISNQMSSTYIPLWSITVIRQCVLLIIWLCQPVDCGHACFTRSITNIKNIGFCYNSHTYTPECTWMEAVLSGMPNEPVSIVSSW